jgi:hypothetical protein
MKKILFIGLLFIIGIALSVIGVNAHSSVDNDRNPWSYDHNDRSYGHCHDDYQSMDYQMAYNRLSDEDRIEIDIILAERIEAEDLEGLSQEEKIDIINGIKEDVLEYIYENYDLERYPY